MPAGRKTMALAVCLGMALTVSACTDDDPPTPPPTSSGATANPGPSTANPGWSVQPAWQQEGNFDSFPGRPSNALIKVYPLQRIDGRLLLTADIVGRGTAGSTLPGVNFFSRRQSKGTLADVSLVDTTERVRYGPLRQGSAPEPVVYTSDIKRSGLTAGATYRVGAFFPDPGPSVTTMGVDLQLGGMAPAIPVVDGGETAPGLVTGTTAGASTTPGTSTAAGTTTAPATSTTASATTAPGTSPVVPGVESTGVAAPGGGDAGGPLTTWTVATPPADAAIDQHELIAKIVGGTVNESGSGKRGVVSLNADVLFAFDSAKLSGRAGQLVGEARNVLTSKADPTKPVSVIGYTDNKGTTSYNQSLSTKRANEVKKALGKVGDLKLTASGRGEAEPVAPNSTSGGSDNPKGRALNRRVEISYTPKPAPKPTTTAPATSAAPAPTGTAATGGTTLPVATVKGNGVSPARIAATVHPVTVDGTLSLVTLDITSEADTLVIDAFTSRSKANQDLGAFSIVDPATKRVYVPAYDSDDYYRVLSTYTHRLAAGQPQHLAFYAAALPDSLTSADVDLDQLGVAKNVPVQR